ncbi:5619_t:CDS:2 [Rhizophagus irregularis]|nr:5619_t:CDS:2 [Rhizophagus irregularis]
MATNTFDQFSKTASNNGLTSVATQRTSINSLLNPEPDEQQKSFNTTSTSYSTQSNDDWYDHQSLENQQGQNWRRYSSPNLSPESSSTSNSNNNKNGLTINYCDDTSSSQQSSQMDSSVSQSMPTTPVLKHSSPMSDYNGTNNIDDKASSSSAPSSRRSSMNRSSGSGQAINSSSNGNSNMITPPQTPGIKSPTKANFSFPPSVTSCEQIMPQKVKRKRITQEQLQDLVAMFEQTDTPSYDVREKLAKKLNMTNREVQVWFQNRRAKANRAKANEHSASHQHHRFLHHHSVSTTQAASGHASSINMLPHGNFTFVPMFANGGPSTGGPVRGRSNRRHSYVSPPTNNNQKKVSQEAPLTRPRASTVTGAPMTSMSSHIVPPSPISPIMPITPISPTTPTLPPINYMLSNINNLTLPPPVPPIKDLLSSEYQQSAYQQQSHNSHQQQQILLPAPQSRYSDVTMTKATEVNSSSEPSLDLLATAAELVQSEEKEKERLKALTIKIEPQEEIENDKKSWRPWLI